MQDMYTYKGNEILSAVSNIAAKKFFIYSFDDIVDDDPDTKNDRWAIYLEICLPFIEDDVIDLSSPDQTKRLNIPMIRQPRGWSD